jgi:hypothetical protein
LQPLDPSLARFFGDDDMLSRHFGNLAVELVTPVVARHAHQHVPEPVRHLVADPPQLVLGVPVELAQRLLEQCLDDVGDAHRCDSCHGKTEDPACSAANGMAQSKKKEPDASDGRRRPACDGLFLIPDLLSGPADTHLSDVVRDDSAGGRQFQDADWATAYGGCTGRIIR